MRKTLTKTSYKPPIDELPQYAVVYGEHEIALGYCETEGEAQRQADALNKQAPQYNHRVKDLSRG